MRAVRARASKRDARASDRDRSLIVHLGDGCGGNRQGVLAGRDRRRARSQPGRQAIGRRFVAARVEPCIPITAPTGRRVPGRRDRRASVRSAVPRGQCGVSVCRSRGVAICRACGRAVCCERGVVEVRVVEARVDPEGWAVHLPAAGRGGQPGRAKREQRGPREAPCRRSAQTRRRPERVVERATAEGAHGLGHPRVTGATRAWTQCGHGYPLAHKPTARGGSGQTRSSRGQTGRDHYPILGRCSPADLIRRLLRRFHRRSASRGPPGFPPPRS